MSTGSSSMAAGRRFARSMLRRSILRRFCGACSFEKIPASCSPVPRFRWGEAISRIFETALEPATPAPARSAVPFDYQRQMSIHLVRKMPEPKDPGYEPALEKWIAHFADQSRARAFVLFTSYQTMRAAAQALEAHFAAKGWNLLVQGNGMPAHRMVQEFRRSSESILFGVDSFWSGVDVPGEALSSVIITRLPFVTPDHPLTEARLESIEVEGGRPFEQYSLPEAILKLRQGVGRLIRSKSDTGTIVILDSRILSKPYGRAFLRALPECPTQIH